MTLTAVAVPIDSVQPHPRNPRRGNVAMIADSLRHHGQYRPIVAHVQTRHILAGTHTWKAAKSLGWQEIAVTWFDGPEDAALRVLLADNRTADLASYRDDALLDLLATLPSFDGTGFTATEVDEMDGEASGPYRPPREPSEPPIGVPIRVGPWRCRVEDDVFAAWQASVEGKCPTKSAAIGMIRARLGLPDPEKPAPRAEKPPRAPITGAEHRTAVDVETVPLSALTLHPANPREGDIGAICESLAANGQYRPVVANRRTGRILVGNHTAQAIQALGWDRIAAAWVDVDEHEETRIVLVDNRTADVAVYDTDELLALLAGLRDLDGTGWSLDDLSELGDAGRPGPQRARSVTVAIGPFRLRVEREAFDRWATGLPLGEEMRSVLERLDIPAGAMIEEQP